MKLLQRAAPLWLVIPVKTLLLGVAVLSAGVGFLGWDLARIMLEAGAFQFTPLFLVWYSTPWIASMFVVLSAIGIKRIDWDALIDPLCAAIFGAASALWTFRLAQIEVA